MGDWLQTSANIVQVVGGLWALFLGGKTVFDLVKHFRLKQSFPISFSSSSITNFLSIIILVLLIGTYFRSSTSPCQEDGPQVVPSPKSPSFASPGLRPVGKILICKKCDSGFQLTIKSYQIENNIVFSFTAINNTASTIRISFDAFKLKSDADVEPSESDITVYGNPHGPNLPKDEGYISASEQVQIVSIFNFIPYRGISYEAQVYMSDLTNHTPSKMIFEPLTLIF